MYRSGPRIHARYRPAINQGCGRFLRSILRVVPRGGFPPKYYYQGRKQDGTPLGEGPVITKAKSDDRAPGKFAKLSRWE